MFDDYEVVHNFPWETIDSDLERWLAEDAGRGDVTTDNLPLAGIKVTAEVRAKSSGVLCGGGGFVRIVRKADPDLVVDTLMPDGSAYKVGDVVIRVTGDAVAFLRAERTALNLVSHLSGIATITAQFVKKVEGTKARIEDTRKNKPGLRVLEKYAVRCGGGANHRPDLASSVLLKDNHLVLIGADLEDAIAHLKKRVGHTFKIEVEVDDIDEVERAASAGADILMLDNMTPDDGREAVQLAGDQVMIEASGGITLKNVRDWAESGVDIISVGFITHSAPSADLSLEFVLPPGQDRKHQR
jgi:nicotinate-nucleotide pyrophosphorylase (carboxylating)